MRAYRTTEFGKPIVVEDVPDLVASNTEVVVKVQACGLCHSDLHFHAGQIGLGGDQQLHLKDIGVDVPLTLGHEIYGHIASFGPNAGLTQSHIGKPVIVYPWIGCGHCEACLADHDNECATPETIGLQRPGGYGQQVLVRSSKFLVDATGIDPNIAGVYACSGLTAYSALQKLPKHEGWIAIIGMGGVGLMALAVAKGIGFAKIAVIDIDDAKLALATNDYGADFAINSRDDQAARKLLEFTGGLSGVIDFVGSEATEQLAVGLLKIAGTYVNVGLFGGALHIPLAVLTSHQLSLRGSYVGNPGELRSLIEYVRKGMIKPIPIRTLPISKVNEGFEVLHSGAVQGRLVLLQDTEETGTQRQ
jgi:propanol-preferring alcohol dehydrogenase